MDPSGWTPDELARVSRATELEITSRRPEGSYRPYVTIWVVGAVDGLYVRSAHGWNNGWFQRALKSGEGRIRAAEDIANAVTFLASAEAAYITGQVLPVDGGLVMQ